MTPGSNPAIFFGELIGTGILVLMGSGVCAAVALPRSKAKEAGWIVVTFGWGLGVLAGAYSSLYLSGGHINPAVTVGIAANTGDWSEVPIRLLAEVLGGILGAVVCWLSYYRHFREIEGPSLGIFSTVPEIRSYVWNFITEFFATFVLVFFIIAVTLEKGAVTAIAANGMQVLLIALLVVGIGLSLGGPTGYAINPARDLGPRIAHFFMPIPNKGGSDWAYSWVPVVGPLTGALAAGWLGALMF